MSDYTTTAASIIQSVINDGQVQTTNRTLLLDYVNRVQQKILRETQWLFLRSEVQRFITQPGVTDYYIGPVGAAATTAVDTTLNLLDIENVRGDTVYDVTNRKHLPFDTENRLATSQLRFEDGQYRSGRPLTHNTAYSVPNVINIYPSPDNANLYQPVPTTPVCTYIQGGFLSNRLVYTTATLVDTFGNESSPAPRANITGIPYGNLLFAEPPKLDIASASNILYNRWNLYAGYSSTSMTLQTANPLSLATPFTEPTTGISSTILPPTFYLVSSPNATTWQLGVTSGGNLTTTQVTSTGQIPPLALSDSSGNTWVITVNNTGLYVTTEITGGGGFTPVPAIFLKSPDLNYWKVTILTSGLLQTTFQGSSAGTAGPPLPIKNNLTPLYGYVIEFRYQMHRQFITDPANILQVPDKYRDVVIAGVNFYANMYTAQQSDLNVKTMAWRNEFSLGLANIRRDLQINHKTSDVVLPDPASQYYQVSGWGWLNPRP